ncbi:ATP-binding protein [Massilia sp. 9096]|uniref:sensor histidine kinase n=1 Tax=Massilia sp. 9096 TaxID=1500894 RepID=UPI00068FCBFB|nr:ATP-binding protein [Massilia sp. 9096]
MENPKVEPSGIANAGLYRTIAHELPHGAVFVVDAGLRYLLADGSGLRAAGFEPARFEGRTVREAVPAELVEQQEADYLSVLAGQTFSREHEINQRHYHSYGVPLTDADGRPELAFVVSYDITERVQLERRLRLFSDLGDVTRAATDTGPTVAAVADLLRRHLGCRHCYVAEVDPEQMRLTELSTVMRTGAQAQPQDLATLGPGILARLVAGQLATHQHLDSRADSALLAHTGARSCLVCPCMRGPHLLGVVALLADDERSWDDDSHEMLQAAADKTWDAVERCRTLERLREADEQKTRVLAVLGHELRNPLSTLSTGLQLLQRSAAPESGRVLQLMGRQINQMTHLVDDLLSLSYICFGQLELRLERLPAIEVIEAALETQRAQAERKQQRVVLALDTLSAWIEGDRVKLIQVLSNLLGNAIKYTPPGGAITIEASTTHDKLAICVSDTGIGMRPEAAAHMFDLFVRGAPAAHAQAQADGGLGVGLWVVQQLVLAHGGEVEASSPGERRGSRFTVRLPLAPDPHA